MKGSMTLKYMVYLTNYKKHIRHYEDDDTLGASYDHYAHSDGFDDYLETITYNMWCIVVF